MESVNFSMLGDPSIAESLGKKGTSTDLTLYDKKESGIIRTWVAPNGFPEKIQPLMQAINLAEYAVVNITTLDKFAGELATVAGSSCICIDFIMTLEPDGKSVSSSYCFIMPDSTLPKTTVPAPPLHQNNGL